MTAGSETMTAGHVVATPVLRVMAVEPRSGDSGIGASRPIPFEVGDFLDSTGPRDILDALGLDYDIAAVLRDTRMPEDHTSALLLGALLSGEGRSGSETAVHEVEEPEVGGMDTKGPKPEAVAEERVTVVDEVRAYLAGEHPGFALGIYAPRLHFSSQWGW